MICGHLHPGTCTTSSCSTYPRQGQPSQLLKAALSQGMSLDGTSLAHCRLNPSPDQANHLILSEPRFQKLQGRHLRHLSGLHWVPACIDPEATLASYPNLESLEFQWRDRLHSGPEHSERWCVLPSVISAVTTGGRLPVCLLSAAVQCLQPAPVLARLP